MRRPITTAVVLALALLAACRAQQLGQDQDAIRQTVLHLYERQIIDNLIRTWHGKPLVQIDYTRITGTIDQTASASAEAST